MTPTLTITEGIVSIIIPVGMGVNFHPKDLASYRDDAVWSTARSDGEPMPAPGYILQERHFETREQPAHTDYKWHILVKRDINAWPCAGDVVRCWSYADGDFVPALVTGVRDIAGIQYFVHLQQPSRAAPRSMWVDAKDIMKWE